MLPIADEIRLNEWRQALASAEAEPIVLVAVHPRGTPNHVSVFSADTVRAGTYAELVELCVRALATVSEDVVAVRRQDLIGSCN